MEHGLVVHLWSTQRCLYLYLRPCLCLYLFLCELPKYLCRANLNQRAKYFSQRAVPNPTPAPAPALGPARTWWQTRKSIINWPYLQWIISAPQRQQWVQPEAGVGWIGDGVVATTCAGDDDFRDQVQLNSRNDETAAVAQCQRPVLFKCHSTLLLPAPPLHTYTHTSIYLCMHVYLFIHFPQRTWWDSEKCYWICAKCRNKCRTINGQDNRAISDKFDTVELFIEIIDLI